MSRAALVERIESRAHRQGLSVEIDASRPLVDIVIARQMLSCWLADGKRLDYPVSTAKNGPGCVENSGCTPTGLHRIAERIGAGEPSGMIFEGRQATGQLAKPDSTSFDVNHLHENDREQITSRILWLDGLEPGHNRGPGCDSHERYIYLHGTSDEARLGQVVSLGCVRLANADVIELFDVLEEGDLLLIE